MLGSYPRCFKELFFQNNFFDIWNSPGVRYSKNNSLRKRKPRSLVLKRSRVCCRNKVKATIPDSECKKNLIMFVWGCSLSLIMERKILVGLFHTSPFLSWPQQAHPLWNTWSGMNWAAVGMEAVLLTSGNTSLLWVFSFPIYLPA